MENARNRRLDADFDSLEDKAVTIRERDSMDQVRLPVADVADWLREQGYQLDVANSLATANEALGRKAYDLLLVDIRLGGEDGLDVLAAIKRSSMFTPVIVVTGQDRIPDQSCGLVRLSV